MLKRIMALLMVVGMSLVALPAHADDYNHRAIEPDPLTVPTLVSVGDTGQILPEQNGPYASFRHGFTYKVSDSSVLSVEADGIWRALKNGTVDLEIIPVTHETRSAEFDAEMAAAGFEWPEVFPDVYVSKHFRVTISDIVPVYRLYNSVTLEHLYTIDENEKNILSGLRDWAYEGVAWQAAKDAGTPVYRLYNHSIGQHHYTSDANEISVLPGRGWANEGIAYYSAGINGVHRLYHEAAKVHLLTIDSREARILEGLGWRHENDEAFLAR